MAEWLAMGLIGGMICLFALILHGFPHLIQEKGTPLHMTV